MADIKVEEDYIDLQIEGMDIKIEDSNKFEKSYYSYEYERAFHALHSILVSDQAPSNKNRQKLIESYNIIAFIGERGSGKSSAMESFAAALNNIHEKSDIKGNSTFSNIYEKLKKYSFYALPSIDGSLLESQEDIFKITLGQMYGELVILNNNELSRTSSQSYQRMLDFEKREVQKSFVELYRSAGKMEQVDGNIEEATITSLKDLSNSLKLRKDFKDLVKQYLDLIYKMRNISVESQVSAEKRYLVILIDDLDMNIRNGYEMMEKIHRYLMVPGVIVLMSLDLIQLKMLFEGGFYAMVPRVNKILKQRQSHISKLATEYTDKVLPIGSRIYMPNFKQKTNLRISFSEKGKDSQDGARKTRSLKEYFFKELYEKSGMRFDHVGKKWHFYIPETMRGTVNFYLMLNQINNLTKLKEKIDNWEVNDWKVFEPNYTYLIGDIENRMAMEKLDPDQYQKLQIWADNQLERTCTTVVKYIVNLAATSKYEEEKERLGDFRTDYRVFEYSFGELLRSLYLWGRAKDSNKRIVHCILAYLTAQMTRNYYEMLRYDYQESRKEGKEKNSKENEINENPYRKTLSYILNGSMLGSWSNRMLPEFEEASQTSFASKGNIGTLKNISVSLVQFHLRLSSIVVPEKIISGNFRNEKKVEEYRKIFRTMEFFALFFTEKIYKSTPTMKWELVGLKNAPPLFSGKERDLLDHNILGDAVSVPKKEGASEPVNEMTVNFKEGHPNFNMYGFMANLFDWEEKSKTLEESLYDCLFYKKTGNSIDEKINKEKVLTEEYIETRKQFLEIIGIQDELKKWHDISAGFVLPFYSVDITYNLIKRMRQDLYGHYITFQNAEGIYKYFKETLDNLYKRLLASDKYYEIVDENKIKIIDEGKLVDLRDAGLFSSFAANFKHCPFVQWALNPGKYLVDDFLSMFDDLLKQVVVKSDSISTSMTSSGIEDENLD